MHQQQIKFQCYYPAMRHVCSDIQCLSLTCCAWCQRRRWRQRRKDRRGVCVSSRMLVTSQDIIIGLEDITGLYSYCWEISERKMTGVTHSRDVYPHYRITWSSTTTHNFKVLPFLVGSLTTYAATIISPSSKLVSIVMQSKSTLGHALLPLD